MRYFFTGVSEAGRGLPEFAIVGYLDDQRFVVYDSQSRRDVPQTAWIQEAEKDDPHYWDWQTHLSRHWELFFRLNLWSRHNDSHGGWGAGAGRCLARREEGLAGRPPQGRGATR